MPPPSGQSAAASEALRALLSGRDAPPHRIELACRAVETLLERAVTRRDDGTAYVITGDIPAMWLRDSVAQVAPLLALADEVPDLVDLVAGVLRRQVEQVLTDPLANAFNPGPTGAAMRRDFGGQSPWVYERKYAVDSLCAPLTLAWKLWRATESAAHVDERFREAAAAIVALWQRGQDHERGSYVLRRRIARRSDSLSHRGRGAPFAPTGMTWSAFRPSDDACRYPYHVPANAAAAVALERLGELLGADEALGVAAGALAAELRAGIADHGIATVSGGAQIYAYEVDGLGRQLLLDDANVPSLLSLPYVGFCDRNDSLYRSTRSWALSPANPLWTAGRGVRGIGSTHTRRGWVWPLAIAVEGLTAPDDAERSAALDRIEATVTGDGLLHESVNATNPRRFTRRWFSWADMLYVELVLDAAGIARP